MKNSIYLFAISVFMLLLLGVFAPFSRLSVLLNDWKPDKWPLLIVVAIWGCLGLVLSYQLLHRMFEIVARQEAQKAQLEAEDKFNNRPQPSKPKPDFTDFEELIAIHQNNAEISFDNFKTLYGFYKDKNL